MMVIDIDELMSLSTTDNEAREGNILRAPFAYPGGKQRALKHILPHLPYRQVYVEPFGGAASVLLARRLSGLEVYNDRYGGVVCFYRCIRDSKKCQALIERLSLMIHAREEWAWCKDTWESVTGDVERAARWYYTTAFSFASQGRAFGRSLTKSNQLIEKHWRSLLDFDRLHNRLKNVQFENQDWRGILKDFDSPDTVFYIDPPYLNCGKEMFGHQMSEEDHIDLCDRIIELDGFVALSGYANHVYDKYPWDDVFVWENYVSIESKSKTSNLKGAPKSSDRVNRAMEHLWIKY